MQRKSIGRGESCFGKRGISVLYSDDKEMIWRDGEENGSGRELESDIAEVLNGTLIGV